ncbi:MAG: YebC/PmpR family DNA-binding transcriptional regulator [Firmicutes bacterium]|nr:YebC/PmpR family DNA-binding transcriptional regulator [Bacillota bacterium]
MSGHSKWHNIKVKKEKVDAAKGKIFTRVSKEIMLAVKEGGADPAGNYRLATAVENAKSVNMPNSNIQRAIEKASGEKGGEGIEEVMYEGYGPHGVAIIVAAATENRNRTVPEVRTAFAKNGGTMGDSGCVSWMFEKKAVFQVSADSTDEDTLMEIALDAGADDVKEEDGIFVVTADFTNFAQVKRGLEAKKVKLDSAEISMIAKNEVKLTDKAQVEAVFKLMDALEEQGDVQNVYANFDIPEEIMASMGGK